MKASWYVITTSMDSGFFAERYSSLAGCFPPLDLPKEVTDKWPLQASAGTQVDKRFLPIIQATHFAILLVLFEYMFSNDK